MTIRADNYFAMIPEWILDADISAQAVRLYCVLRRYADQGGRCYPSRKRIAERMRVSPATVDRAVQELVDLEAIRVRQRYNPETREHTSNEYLVLSNLPLGLLADDETYSAEEETYSAEEETGLLAGDELTRATMNESQELELSLAVANENDSNDERLGFEGWWTAYPRKVGKGAALRKWRSMPPADRERALDAVREHVEHWRRERIEQRFIPHPATWLSQARWDDDLATEARREPSMPSAVRHAAELLARARSAPSEQASYERELESTYEEEWL